MTQNNLRTELTFFSEENYDTEKEKQPQCQVCFDGLPRQMNVHLLRQSNFPETMKNHKKNCSTWRKVIVLHLSAFIWPILWSNNCVNTCAKQSTFFFSFSSSLKYLRQQWWGTSLFRWFKLQNIQECRGVPFLLHYFQRVLLLSIMQGYSHYQRRLSKTIHYLQHLEAYKASCTVSPSAIQTLSRMVNTLDT